jgi:hypothetical protein
MSETITRLCERKLLAVVVDLDTVDRDDVLVVANATLGR